MLCTLNICYSLQPFFDPIGRKKMLEQVFHMIFKQCNYKLHWHKISFFNFLKFMLMPMTVAISWTSSLDRPALELQFPLDHGASRYFINLHDCGQINGLKACFHIPFTHAITALCCIFLLLTLVCWYLWKKIITSKAQRNAESAWGYRMWQLGLKAIVSLILAPHVRIIKFLLNPLIKMEWVRSMKTNSYQTIVDMITFFFAIWTDYSSLMLRHKFGTLGLYSVLLWQHLWNHQFLQLGQPCSAGKSGTTRLHKVIYKIDYNTMAAAFHGY